MSVRGVGEPEAMPFATRPPQALVVWEPAPEAIGAHIDWSRWYLTDEDDMGEGGEQGLLITRFKSILRVLAGERHWSQIYIGSDQFFAWREDEPLVRVSPDVYLIDDPPPRPLPSMWQTWLAGHRPPRFALEIVSGERWRKDYQDNPPKYAQLGSLELVVFDPEVATSQVRNSERVPLQVFRRDADGAFIRVHRGDGPARSDELNAWLVIEREGAAATLRVARDAAGVSLVPDQDEVLAEAERGRAEAERGRMEAERTGEQERQARIAAEQKLAEIDAELRRLRGDAGR